MKKVIESCDLCRCPGENEDLCRECARTSPTRPEFIYSYVQFGVEKADKRQSELLGEPARDKCKGYIPALWVIENDEQN